MRSLSRRIFVTTWMLLCVVLFFAGSGRQSGIHLFYFENWQQLFTQITGIALFAFLGNLIWASIKIALFSLSVWGTGMSLMAWFNKSASLTTNQVDMTPTAFVLGQGVYSIVLLLPIILTQRLPLFYSLAVFLVGLLLALVRIRYIYNEIVQQTRNAIWPREELDRFLIVSSLLVTITAIGYSSSRLSYDAASQYFAQAKNPCCRTAIYFSLIQGYFCWKHPVPD